MQDFISGSSITQGDYKVISIHLDNVDIIENERMEKAVPPVKPNLSREVDLSFFPPLSQFFLTNSLTQKFLDSPSCYPGYHCSRTQR